MLLLQCCALRKFHVTDGQNMHDQIMSDRRSKLAVSKCVLFIPYIVSGNPNECSWLHTCDTFILTTWILGLRAPLVACHQAFSQTLKTGRPEGMFCHKITRD